MQNGLLNPYNFGNRLTYLIGASGIDTNKRGFTTIFSRQLFEEGIVEYNNAHNDETEMAKQRDNVRKRIDAHLKLSSADNVSGLWLHRYCKHFACSSDFLFGLINHPTHELTDITEKTGLSESAIGELKMLKVSDMISNEPNLATVNLLLEQLKNNKTNIIRSISAYLYSKGLSTDTWYNVVDGTLTTTGYNHGTEINVAIPAKSNTFDNLLLMDVQKHIIELKAHINKAPDTK